MLYIQLAYLNMLKIMGELNCSLFFVPKFYDTSNTDAPSHTQGNVFTIPVTASRRATDIHIRLGIP